MPRAASATASALSPCPAFGIGTAISRRASPVKLPQEARAVLGRQHADDQHQRARHALLEIGERRGDGAAAVRIVAAVEPELRCPAGASATSAPCVSRCMRAGQSALAMPGLERGRRNLQRLIARSAAMASPAFSN